MTDKEDLEDLNCECEDPFNVGSKLRLCGQAICLRLHNMKVPKPKIILAESEDDDEA